MSLLGNIFGWLIVAGLAVTLLNYPIKVIYRKKIARLPKDSVLRRRYGLVQRFVVQYHRFFAGFTTVAMIVHLVIQLQYRWLSWTGLVTAILMLCNGFLGGYGHYIKQKKKSAWLYIHRTIAVLMIAALAVHLATGGR